MPLLFGGWSRHDWTQPERTHSKRPAALPPAAWNRHPAPCPERPATTDHCRRLTEAGEPLSDSPSRAPRGRREEMQLPCQLPREARFAVQNRRKRRKNDFLAVDAAGPGIPARNHQLGETPGEPRRGGNQKACFPRENAGSHHSGERLTDVVRRVTDDDSGRSAGIACRAALTTRGSRQFPGGESHAPRSRPRNRPSDSIR